MQKAAKDSWRHVALSACVSCKIRHFVAFRWHDASQVVWSLLPGDIYVTGRQMIAVGVRRLVLARGELDRLEGPGYAARRAELRRKAKEAERTRERQAAAASQNEAEESDATEEEATGGRTTRVGRPRGGMKVAARIGERLRREIGRGRLPRVGDG